MGRKNWRKNRMRDTRRWKRNELGREGKERQNVKRKRKARVVELVR